MENADAVRLTLLGGGTPVDEDELYRLYSYPAELTRCVVRGNMISRLDGAATNDGISGGLGGAGFGVAFGSCHGGQQRSGEKDHQQDGEGHCAALGDELGAGLGAGHFLEAPDVESRRRSLH